MIRRTLTLCTLSLIMAFISSVWQGARAYDFGSNDRNIDGQLYRLDQTAKVARLYRWQTKTEHVQVPAKVTYEGADYTVVEVGDPNYSYYVFYDEGVRKAVRRITLPSSVKVIDNSAFSYCDSLTQVDLPDGLETIGIYAFSGCPRLQISSLPSKLKTIGDRAFLNVPIHEISIPASVETIGGDAFGWNNRYTPLRLTMLGSTPPAMNWHITGSNADLFTVRVPAGSGAAYRAANDWKQLVIIEGLGVSLDIAVSAPGKLGDQILGQTDNIYDVNTLKVSGEINDDDIYNIRSRMPNLIDLDLSGTTLTALPKSFLDGRKAIERLVLPAGLRTIGHYAFRYCYSLPEVSLPQTLQSIGDCAFEDCRSLAGISLPDSVGSIGYHAFGACRRLTSAKLPAALKEVAQGLFYCCDLQEIDIPEGVVSIGSDAFRENNNLKRVSLPLSLRSLNNVCFYGCGFEEIALPALTYAEQPFYYCKNLKTISCTAVIPPRLGNTDLQYGTDKRTVRLNVPAIAAADYKQTAGWDAYDIHAADIWPDAIDVTRDFTLELPATLPAAWKPEVTGGVVDSRRRSLTVKGAATLSMSRFQLSYDNYAANDNRNDGYYNCLIADAPMRSDRVETDYNCSTEKWHFISMPYDVRVADITLSAPVPYVIRAYDGAARAEGRTGQTWVELTEDSVMHAGQGYILRASGWNQYSVEFRFPALNNENKNRIFASADRALPLKAHNAEFAHNRGWNLTANPYPAYFDTRLMSLAQPFTVWSESNFRYEAYSPVDDKYVLFPGQAFFVQRPVDEENITFYREGRQTTLAASAQPAPHSAQARAPQHTTDRQIINLLTQDNEGRCGRCRVVINPLAQPDYCASEDAPAFFAAEAAGAELYSIEGSLPLAINERPAADGRIRLGLRAADETPLTISLDTEADITATIHDAETGRSVCLNQSDYTLTAHPGTADSRLTLTLTQNATGITSVSTDAAAAPETIYNLNGQRLDRTAAPGIYIINGKKTRR